MTSYRKMKFFRVYYIRLSQSALFFPYKLYRKLCNMLTAQITFTKYLETV